MIDTDLKFEQHISSKIAKANSIAGLIRRSFSFLDGQLFKQLFTSFVRPHLEYCERVWSPHLRKDINRIESVQRRATKLVDGLRNLSYEERLRKLDLPTLAFRRLRGDMIELYKHHHLYDSRCLSSSFRPKCKPRHHDAQLARNFANDGVRGCQHNSFYYRTIQTWNELPRNVVSAGTLNSFKNRLDKYWKEHPMRFNHEQTKDEDS